EIAASLTPDVVLRFGPLPVSKPLTEYLERHRSATHILVDDGPDWADQSRLSSLVVSASPIAFCEALSEAVQPNGDSRSAWTSRWLGLDQAARTAMDKAIGEFDGLSETRLFAELAPLLPDGASVFGGSSMPVRDMDSFVPGSEKRLEFASNRGASGIDGVVSTALGMAAGSGRRVVLVIGDISFYHDMNGLLAAKLHEINATIIVVNNDGGGIFSFLPQAEYEEVFEPYFGTPHGLTFRDAAALYGTDYALAGDWPGFRSAVANSFSQPGVSIIEVPVADRSTNVAQHRVVWRQASAGRRALAGG
ncbi:MAG: thiamine pyrophosphate-dependent enzyme, partial [Dehalococcoidia bacterium]